MLAGDEGVMAEAWRVAQLVVDRGAGRAGSRGSGYLVGPGLVLTAAHVVAGAVTVRVRLDVGQPAEVGVRAEDWWADPQGQHGTDLAVVMIAQDATAGREIEPARFGRISEGMAVLAVQAFGFPRFKLRGDAADDGGAGVFRDLEQVTGHAPVAANRRQGTLAVYLDDPPPATPEPGGSSPWAGMSGAAVWADGRIVAVVAEHHPSEGTGRLTGRRIDRAYDQLPEPDLGRLADWLGLAPAIGGQADVVPAGPGQLVRAAYLAQVRDIAPDALIGRDGELAQWTEFCAGADPYAWWQAGPWAGKTALASWFVTHPPAGVDIISFFITGRLLGQADSDAFVEAMIGQLTALAPAHGGSAAVAGVRVGAWLSQLESAAAQAKERRRRLVVVVDGLDEDDAGAAPARGRPSIASQLPRRPPAGVRVIVTSRPDPGLPDDVLSGHPLRTCIPRPLAGSWVAEDLALRAGQELRDLLTGDQTGLDVVGYIASSGGGLTMSDLEALTGVPPLKLDPVLRGVAGRSLQTRASANARDADAATRVYLFAHETLRITAEEQLGAELARYREKIHDWIGSYAALGWPDSTPGYAVQGYPRLLTDTSDATRLSALARDPRRHAFLLRATGSDYAAVAEIRTARGLLADQKVPDLQALVELAVFRHAISIRNRSIPADLPVVWARLGRFNHAEALARTFTDPHAQARALAELASTATQAGDPDRASRLATDAEAMARTITNRVARAGALADVAGAAARAGDLDRAEALARDITDPDYQARALTELARAAARAGDPDRASRLATDAEAMARTIINPFARAGALADVAGAAARAGDLDRAEALTRTITNPDVEAPDYQARALADVAGAAARAGDPDRAEALARDITDPDYQARAFTELARAVTRAGDPDRASRLATEAEAIARSITYPYRQAEKLTELARAAAQAGDPDRASRLATEAEAIARTITDPGAQARALADVASAAGQAGDPDRASHLAAKAEALARTITDPRVQAYELAALASATARAGDLDRAEALARAITYPYQQAEKLTELASAAVRAGDPDRASRLADEAEAIARTITDPDAQAQALAELASAAARAGDLDRAQALTRTITEPDAQARALAELASATARAGDLDRAEALARSITEPIIYPDYQASALADVASEAARAGDLDRAEALARAITNPSRQAEKLTELVGVAVQAGDLDRAEALARTITEPDAQARALAELASAAAQVGDLDRAEALARDITNPYLQVRTLTELARAVAQAGDPDRASRLADEAEAIARDITHPGPQARALADVASEAAQAGDPDRASRLADVAEAIARTITDPDSQGWVLAALASAAARADDLDRAEALARDITDLDDQKRALIEMARAAARAGDPDRASRLATEAEAITRTITDPDAQARALADVARAAAQAGDPDRASRLADEAEAIARTITDPDAQAQALAELARAAAWAGDPDRARRLLALALSAESPEIGSWVEGVSHFLPSAIRGAGDVFMSAYKTGAR